MLSAGSRMRSRARGFTIVELMVTLMVVAILAGIAMPTMRSVMINARIKGAAQSIQNGLALARAEAVRLNMQVEFVLQGNGWVIREAITGNVLQEGSGRDGAAGLLLKVTPTGSDRVTFNAFGQTTSANPSNGSLPFTELDLEAPNPPGSGRYRPLRIEIFTGGVARTCDPAADDTEYRACRRG